MTHFMLTQYQADAFSHEHCLDPEPEVKNTGFATVDNQVVTKLNVLRVSRKVKCIYTSGES